MVGTGVGLAVGVVGTGVAGSAVWPTMKLLLLATPFVSIVFTLIGPEVASVGTVAVSRVAEITWKLLAHAPLNRTPVAPQKLLPVTDTVVPVGPPVGLKLAIRAAG